MCRRVGVGAVAGQRGLEPVGCSSGNPVGGEVVL